MDKLEIKEGSFIQQTQYFIPVEIDLFVVPAHLGISDFFTCGEDFLDIGQSETRIACAGLDINVCPIPVKTDVGQVNLVFRLSNETSEKIRDSQMCISKKSSPLKLPSQMN
jgi:hypothetical protein